MQEQTASKTVALRVREVRGRMTRAELAERLREIGYVDDDGRERLPVSAIGELEREARRVTVDDWLALAAALGVAPIHLIVPFEDPEPVTLPDGQAVGFSSSTELRVGANLTLDPLDARSWIRGTSIYLGADPSQWFRFYAEEVPPARKHELERARAYLEKRDPGPPAVKEDAPRIGVFGEEGWTDLPAPVYAHLFPKEEK